MISHMEAADVCRATYRFPGDPPFKWDHFCDGDDHPGDDGVCYGIVHRGSWDVVALRGSVTLEDWLRDVNAFARPVFHRLDIGWVHAGFYDGMPEAWREIKPLLQAPAIVVGHSLGAARASILAAMMVLDGWPVEQRVVFGEPRPGFKRLGKVVRRIPHNASYRATWRGEVDAITTVPFRFWFWQYVHPTPPINLPVRIAPRDRGGLFALHHIQGYQDALARGP